MNWDGNHVPESETTAVAVIGMACRLPKAENPAAFWRLLENGESADTPIPSAARASVLTTEAGGGAAPRPAGYLDAVDTHRRRLATAGRDAGGRRQLVRRRRDELPRGAHRGAAPRAHGSTRTANRRSRSSAVASRRARIRVPGFEADVTVEDIGEGTAHLRADIDAAYRAKFGDAGAESMVTASAVTTTLRLRPA